MLFLRFGAGVCFLLHNFCGVDLADRAKGGFILGFILECFRGVVILLLYAIEFAMLCRAVLSWIPMDPNKFTDFIYAVTEPIIYPVRVLFHKLNWFQSMPIDMSFFVTFLLLNFLVMILA